MQHVAVEKWDKTLASVDYCKTRLCDNSKEELAILNIYVTEDWGVDRKSYPVE